MSELEEDLKMANEWSDATFQREEAERNRAEMRKMIQEDLLEELRKEFQVYLATHEPSRGTLIEAWKLYGEVVLADLKLRMPEAGITKLHEVQMQAMLSVLNGERSPFSGELSSYHFGFSLATFMPVAERNSVGRFLEGLEGEDLENAQAFCQAMNEVGWRTGDLHEKYPGQ